MWDLMATVDYIASRGYQRVALQFPDEHLDEAPLVAAALAQELAAVSTAQVTHSHGGGRATHHMPCMHAARPRAALPAPRLRPLLLKPAGIRTR